MSKRPLTKFHKAARGDPSFDIQSAWFPIPRNPNPKQELHIIRILHQEFCPCCHARLDFDANAIRVRSPGERVYGNLMLLCTDCSEGRPCTRRQASCPPGRSAIARFRYQKWKEDPYCYYCQRKMRLCESTIDHVVPRCKGGGTGGKQRVNWVLCCTE